MNGKKTKTPAAPARDEKLQLAVEHGHLVVGRGVPNAIPTLTYVRLVGAGFLTPHADGTPFTGEALVMQTGKLGYLTAKGLEAATAAAREKAS